MPKLAEPELRISVISWDACKAEVLKILRENSDMNIWDLIKEIEKL